MATATVNKCDQCGMLFENTPDYCDHIHMHEQEAAFEKEFSAVEDSHCKFSNGSYSVQRSRDWFEQLAEWIINSVKPLKIEYPPWSYGWFRTLDDGGHWQYKISYRWNCICQKCYREWGQPYYANHCACKD